ncbi:MAG TPA: ribbon-helix-helix protein, CopG family [Candidatus Lokiarchaeia archaeon]
MKKTSKNISTRINNDDVKKLDEIAKKENIDRSVLVRKFILQMLKEYEIKRTTELFRKGIVSLQEAASQASVSIYEIMDYVQRENIHPPDQSKEEILTEIDKSKKFIS